MTGQSSFSLDGYDTIDDISAVLSGGFMHFDDNGNTGTDTITISDVTFTNI